MFGIIHYVTKLPLLVEKFHYVYHQGTAEDNQNLPFLSAVCQHKPIDIFKADIDSCCEDHYSSNYIFSYSEM